MRSSAGVGITPPNVLATPKPASSVMIRSQAISLQEQCEATVQHMFLAFHHTERLLTVFHSYLSVTPESETHGFSRVLHSPTHTEFAPLSWCRAVPGAQLRILPPPTEFVLSCSAGPTRRESLAIANRTHAQNPQSASARCHFLARCRHTLPWHHCASGHC